MVRTSPFGTFGWVAGLALCAVGCTNVEDGGLVDPASAALSGPVPAVGQFVVLASHGASFDDRSVVSGGDLGVAAGTTSSLDKLTAGFEARVGVGEVLLAPKVVLRDRAVAGEIGATVIDAPHAKTGPRSAFVAPPAAPTPGSFTAGKTPVDVPRKKTSSLAPGKYGAVTVEGTLSLAGGLYELASLRLGNDARVVALAAATVRIAGGLAAADRATAAPAAGLHARDLRLVVAGTLDGHTAVAWGNDGRLVALVVAGGTVRAGDRFVASGAISAMDVNLGDDTRLAFDGGFECGSAASCDDGNPCTTDACVDARCTHAPVAMCPAQADLALAKMVSNPMAEVGDTIVYVVTLTNAGPGQATGVTVTDLLPAGVTFVSATPSLGTYTPTSGLWSVGTVSAGTSQTLQITALVASPSSETNTATITHADQLDPNPANNSASATETPQQADLALTKTVSNASPSVGDTITYVVTLVNAGPGVATNVTVTDLLPAGLTFASATSSQGAYNATNGLWTVGTVPPGSQTLQIGALVTSPSAQTNTAAVSHADQFDPNPADNSASVTETPEASAELSVAKTVSNATPNVGDAVTFTVTVANAGPSAATNVAVTDVLPPGLVFVSASASMGSYDSSSGVWSVGTIAPGSSQTLQLVARVVSPSAQTNTATITHTDQNDPDGANNTASATETPRQADLALTKTVSNPSPNVGDTIAYLVTLSNNGPNPGTNVAVTDALPPGMLFVSAVPSQGTYDPGSGLWAVGTVTAGSSQTLLLEALVASANPQTNTATITGSDELDPVVANNSASATESPQQADLALTKTVDNPMAIVGNTVTYVVTLTNGGPNAATNVEVTDLLPPGLALVSAAASQGSYNGGIGLWLVGSMPSGGTQTLQLVARVVSPATETNTASVSHSDQFDPNPSNNSASATETPLQLADLSLAKTVNNAAPNVGDDIIYVVTLSNAGLADATSVTVTDLLPGGLAFLSATPSQGTYDAGSGLWAVGTVTTGSAQTLQLTARVLSPNPQTNTATVTGAAETDPNVLNNSASATESPQQADLALTKTVDNPMATVGATVTYLVTLTNGGPDAATNVVVTDLLPAGLALVSTTASQGSYNPGTGLWAVGSIPSGGTQTLQLVARVVSPAAETNTASVSHSDQFDPNSSNNSASATETPLQLADLSLAKTVNNATPNVGDDIVYVVTLSNAGLADATNVTVTDLLPGGLAFLSATPSQGTYDAGSGLWAVGMVTAGTSRTLQLTARVVSPAAQTNTAVVSHADQTDPDVANNSASATETPQGADLVVAKTINNATPSVGGTVTYRVTVSNFGPQAATNVTVTDLLPAGLTLVLVSSSRGSYDPGTGIWSVGTVTSGGAQTLTLGAKVVSASAQTNTAAVSHSDQFDPNMANNSASVTETPQ